MVNIRIELVILVYFSLSLLSLIISILLFNKFFKDKKEKYEIHSMTKLLALLTFFLFTDSFYYTLLYGSQYRFLPESIFFKLSIPSLQVLPKLGIFIATIVLVHFIFDKKIEKFRDREKGIKKLELMNKELEKKAEELQDSQDILRKKVNELERFNTIAKERETKMLNLIKKIEVLEEKLEKKK